MSLENINCPQFVDFSSIEAFDIHDGADLFFEKRIVGELDLGFGSMKIQNEEDFANILSNATNMQPKDDDRHKTMVIKKKQPVTPTLPEIKTPKLEHDKENSPATPKQQQKENSPATPKQQLKENSPAMPKQQHKEKTIVSCTISTSTTTVVKQEVAQDYQTLVGTTTNVSSAIELVSSTVLMNKPKPQPVAAKPETPIRAPRQRSNSNVSTSSAGSSKQASQQSLMNRLAAPVQPKAKPTQTGSQNIVKKTLAKMTAAFKQTKQLSLDVPSKSAGFDAFSLKNKLLSSKKSKVGSGSANQPVKVEYGDAMNVNEPLSPTHQTSSNRRCSSVPRTLREKQALHKAGIINDEASELNENVEQLNEPIANSGFIPTQTTTLGEKIQNFFNSHSSSSSSSHAVGSELNKMSSKSKANKIAENKLKSHVPQPKALVSKTLNHTQLVKTDSQDSEDIRVNPETNETKLVGHNSRRSQNSTTDSVDVKPKPVVPKVSMSPAFALGKARQRSADRGPVMPLYKGVKFIPKLSQKYHQSSIESDRIEDLLKHRPAMLPKMQPIAASTKPLLEFQKRAPVAGLTRATPGKSASFKQSQHNSPGLNSESSTLKPAHLNRTATGASASAANDTCNMTREDSHLKTFNESTASSARVNSSSNLSSFNTSNMRKRSETKPCGLLHTELRALKRNEFDQSLKEKERMAVLLRRELEEEKMKRQQEEIQKIRAQRNFRSRPIKHYKPVEVKPSEKPLTEPRSPQLGVSFKNMSGMKTISSSSLQLSSYSAANALVDAPLVSVSNLKQNGLAISHDDVRFNY